MLEQLKTIYIAPTRYIRLSFRYTLPNKQVKILKLMLRIKISDSRQLNIFTFINAIKNDIIMNFLLLQHEEVKWETISITYPTKKNTKLDILKLPLSDMMGQVDCNIDEPNLHALNMSIRFQGRPMPTNLKVHGIYNPKTNGSDIIIENCNKIFTQEFFIPGAQVNYDIVFPLEKRIESNKKNKKSIQKTRLSHIKPIIAITDVR